MSESGMRFKEMEGFLKTPMTHIPSHLTHELPMSSVTTSVMGVLKNPPISENLIPLTLIMICECQALLLAGSPILKETKAHF